MECGRPPFGPTVSERNSMNPRKVKTAADARRIVAARKLDHVKVGVFDADGILRGKYMARDKFLSALTGGFGFWRIDIEHSE